MLPSSYHHCTAGTVHTIDYAGCEISQLQQNMRHILSVICILTYSSSTLIQTPTNVSNCISENIFSRSPGNVIKHWVVLAGQQILSSSFFTQQSFGLCLSRYFIYFIVCIAMHTSTGCYNSEDFLFRIWLQEALSFKPLARTFWKACQFSYARLFLFYCCLFTKLLEKGFRLCSRNDQNSGTRFFCDFFDQH